MTSPQEILAAAKDKDFKLAGCGLFAQVLVLIEPDIALKIYDEPGEASEVEKRIYQRLGPHPRILRTYGECESVAGKGLALWTRGTAFGIGEIPRGEKTVSGSNSSSLGCVLTVLQMASSSD